MLKPRDKPLSVGLTLTKVYTNHRTRPFYCSIQGSAIAPYCCTHGTATRFVSHETLHNTGDVYRPKVENKPVSVCYFDVSKDLYQASHPTKILLLDTDINSALYCCYHSCGHSGRQLVGVLRMSNSWPVGIRTNTVYWFLS